MKNHDEPSATSVELWVRSYVPVGAEGRATGVLERLQDLEATDRLEDADVRLWGERIRPTPAVGRTEQGRTVLDRLEQFRTWARSTERTLEPAFEWRSREAGGTDGTVIVLPNLAMAEYEAGDLVCVTPHCAGEQRVTVERRLEQLEGTTAEEAPDAAGRPTGVVPAER